MKMILTLGFIEGMEMVDDSILVRMILTLGFFEGMEMVDESILIGQRITRFLISHLLFEVVVVVVVHRHNVGSLVLR